MNKYRVVLQIPESMTDGQIQTFTTEQEADGTEQAVAMARAEAANAFIYCDLEERDFRLLDITCPEPKPEPTEEQCKLCLINRVSEFVYDNTESFSDDDSNVVADLAYIVWAISSNSSFIHFENDDGLVLLLRDLDPELLKELEEKGYILYEVESPEQSNEKRHMAEIAAVVAEYITEEKIKLGGEGMITHYSKIAEIALEFDEEFPVDFDWEEHMDSGGDCWDMEVRDFTESWIAINHKEVGTWD